MSDGQGVVDITTVGKDKEPTPVELYHKKKATLEMIRAADDLGEIDVVMEEWGGLVVTVRGLSRGELQRISAAADGVTPEPEIVNARMIHYGLVDPEVTEEEAQEILEKKSMASTKRLTDAIMEVSGLSDVFPGAASD